MPPRVFSLIHRLVTGVRDIMTERGVLTATDHDEVIVVHDRVVACDGGGGPLGHPRVFLRIVAADIVCPYCSRVYVLAEDAGHDHAH